MTVIDDPVVKDAAENALSALLVDRDVQEVSSLEGGILEVLRRGKRERLDAILEGPLFALLREAGAEAGVVELKLRSAHRLFAGPLADGRIAMRVQKLPSADVSLEMLEEEGVLPPGIGQELVAAVLEGGGLAIVGPARVGRQRVLLAVARAVQSTCSLAGLNDGVPGVSVPLSPRAQLEHRVEAAQSLGADVLVALDLSTRDLALAARARPALPLLASVASPSTEALSAALETAGVPLSAVFGNVAVLGFAPDGRPRLAELHGPARTQTDADGPPPARTAATAPPPMPSAPASSSPHSVAAYAALASGTAGGAVSTAQPPRAFDSGDGPPGSWKADSPDLDPGWELADDSDRPAPAPGSFDAVLRANQDAQKTRPSFTPRPPREHPLAGKLKGDPFGGLTFEPPPGGPADADDAGEPAVDGPDSEDPR